MKSVRQMDLEEWELLPDEGYLEINDDQGKKIYSRKYTKGSGSVFQTNYFICPPKSSPEFVDRTRPDQLLRVPIDLAPTTLKPHEGHDHQELVKKESPKIPVEIKIMPPAASENMESFKEQDPVSQVFFKKMKETEFVDMKVESPKAGASREIVPQIEAFQFEEEGDPCKEGKVDSEIDLDECDIEESGLNIWKWSLTGIGAICSFGVAAATVCIIILGSNLKNKHPQHNQKLQFQIYTGDKRVKQAVQRASKINEAISAARGVPFTRAHITFGGYYDAPV
ncbi:hypothetical protein CDL12_07107 [Handroanthus impetiginosus]|uniref:DUF6821 domain-containing protein n=1 Tax=Handroanthus impetiginosus TaxID=429701 RepID=A0A2G9HRQ9_9LAMI|nr:hypothetical protein CDL12_07106 [Handroanthus impetiginosus]PIN20209.1 hypothetical protein CDL12_07107 [Handroanthus impetiginosus]